MFIVCTTAGVLGWPLLLWSVCDDVSDIWDFLKKNQIGRIETFEHKDFRKVDEAVTGTCEERAAPPDHFGGSKAQ